MLFLILLVLIVVGILRLGPGQAGQQGQASSTWRKVSITNAQVVALGAAVSGNIALFTLAAKEILENVVVNVTTPGAGTTTLTMSVGRTGALYVDGIVASDVKTAAIVLGVLSAQRGVNLTAGGDPGGFASRTYYAQFVSTVQNLSAVTGFACNVHYKTATFAG